MSDKKWYEGVEQRVVAAYQATGIKPQQGKWCSCGLGAIAAQMGVDVSKESDDSLSDENGQYKSPEDIAAALVGGTNDEVNAFIAGFDGDDRDGYWRSKSPPASDAGQRSWEAVKAAGLVTE